MESAVLTAWGFYYEVYWYVLKVHNDPFHHRGFVPLPDFNTSLPILLPSILPLFLSFLPLCPFDPFLLFLSFPFFPSPQFPSHLNVFCLFPNIRYTFLVPSYTSVSHISEAMIFEHVDLIYFT